MNGGSLSPESLLGEYREILLARAASDEIRRRRVASGGAVTALLLYMLEKGYVDGVVAAKRDRGLRARLVVARTRDELLEAAGARWDVLPYTRLRDALTDEGLKRVAIVGLPCQVQVLRQMMMYPFFEADFISKIYFLVSLFCLGTFATEPFQALLKIRYGVEPENVSSVSLANGKIRVVHDNTVTEIPLTDILPFMQAGCLLCQDYTGVLADISAGASQKYKGYTVLIVRSEKAEKIVREAIENNYVEARKAGEDVVEEIKAKARSKMERALEYMSMLL